MYFGMSPILCLREGVNKKFTFLDYMSPKLLPPPPLGYKYLFIAFTQAGVTILQMVSIKKVFFQGMMTLCIFTFFRKKLGGGSTPKESDRGHVTQKLIFLKPSLNA